MKPDTPSLGEPERDTGEVTEPVSAAENMLRVAIAMMMSDSPTAYTAESVEQAVQDARDMFPPDRYP